MGFDWHESSAQTARSEFDVVSPTAEGLKPNKAKQDYYREKLQSVVIENSSQAAFLALRERDEEVAGDLQSVWRRSVNASGCTPKLSALLGESNHYSLRNLPPYSWRIRLQITLDSSLFSKNDDAFYPTENPMRRDRALDQPMFAASSWKGCLRSAWRLCFEDKELKVEERLFGSRREQEADAERLRGGLIFSPSWFDKVGFEVINPHERATKKGTPVFYEVVPKGARTSFSVLYCPWNAGTQSRQIQAENSAAGLAKLTEAIVVLFADCGVGAKTTSGFGQIRENDMKESVVEVLLPGAESKAPPSSHASSPQTVQLAGYLQSVDSLKPQYLNQDGSFKLLTPEDLARRPKPERQQYEKAKNWWEREWPKICAEKAAKAEVAKLKATAAPPPRPYHVASAPLTALAELSNAGTKLANQIRDSAQEQKP